MKYNKNRFRIGKVYISITDPDHLIREIEQASNEKKSCYICVSNPRTIDLANHDKSYLEIMDNSFMNIPDAQPVLWGAALWGLKKVKRTMGPLLFHDMLSKPQSGLKHYLLGDTDQTLLKINEKCKQEYGSLISGMYSPPFCELDDYDYEGMGKMIKESGADIVWIAMRAPKQDYLAVRLLQYLDGEICIGVGAAFRFFLDEYTLAPPLIRKLGLMGLYWGKKNQKLIPFLWGYIKDNTPFIYYLLKIPFWRLLGRKYYE